MLRNNRKSSSFTLYVFYRKEGKEEKRKSWSSIGKSFPLEIADWSMEAESVEASFLNLSVCRAKWVASTFSSFHLASRFLPATWFIEPVSLTAQSFSLFFYFSFYSRLPLRKGGKLRREYIITRQTYYEGNGRTGLWSARKKNKYKIKNNRPTRRRRRIADLGNHRLNIMHCRTPSVRRSRGVKQKEGGGKKPILAFTTSRRRGSL